MRYNTFRGLLGIVLGVLGLTLCGGLVLLLRSCQSAEPRTSQPVAAATPMPGNTPQPLIGNRSPNGQPRSTSSQLDDPRRDKLIADYLAAHPQAIGDKAKDVMPREAFKVNLYADNGSPTWNRLKVDYNRNEKWDEKWDLTDGQPVKRHVASRDNEVYDREYRWQGGRWVEKK